MLSIVVTLKTENKQTKKGLNIKGWKMVYQADMNGKKIRVAFWIADKIEFKWTNHHNKEEFYMLMKEQAKPQPLVIYITKNNPLNLFNNW